MAITLTSPSSLEIDAREWVGKSPTASDKGPQLQRAITSVWESGDKRAIRFPAFPVYTSQPIRIYGEREYKGYGASSVLILGANSNTDVLKAYKEGEGGQSYWVIRDLTIDGNRTNNPSGGKGLIADGQRLKHANLNVRNCNGIGFDLKQSGADLNNANGGPDTVNENIWVYNNAGGGLRWATHDTSFKTVRCVANGPFGMESVTGGNSAVLIECHNYGAQERGFVFNESFNALNCQSEGASIAQVRCKGGGQWRGGAVFALNSGGAGIANVTGFEVVENSTSLTVDTAILRCGTGGAYKWLGSASGRRSKLSGIVEDTTVFVNGSEGTPSGSIDTSGLRLTGTSTLGETAAIPLYTVAAANELVVETLPVIRVTGSTEIKKIKATLPPQTRITLYFTGTAKVIDGENLRLNGNFEATPDDSLTLTTDGVNFYEVARSAN